VGALQPRRQTFSESDLAKRAKIRQAELDKILDSLEQEA